MKKLLLVLLVALFASMVVAWSPASISLYGVTRSDVILTNDGLSVDMYFIDGPYVDISGSANGVDFSLGLDLSYEASTTGLTSTETAYIYDVNTGWKVNFNQLTLDSTDFAASWYSSKIFGPDPNYWGRSLGWFVEVDDMIAAKTSVLDFKKYNFSLGFQTGKAAAKAAVGPLNIAAQVTLDALKFDKFAAEISSEDIFAGLGFRVGYITEASYTANAWYKNSFDLDVVKADVNLYGRYSNFNGQHAGLIAHIGKYATSTAGEYDVNLGAKGYYDFEPATDTLLLQARFDGSFEYDPVSVDLRVGSGYYEDWDDVWWEEFHGDLNTNIKDVSGRIRAEVGLPFETELLTGPAIGIGADYYLDDYSWTAPVYFIGYVYDMVEFKVGTDLESVEDWYVRFRYTASF